MTFQVVFSMILMIYYVQQVFSITNSINSETKDIQNNLNSNYNFSNTKNDLEDDKNQDILQEKGSKKRSLFGENRKSQFSYYHPSAEGNYGLGLTNYGEYHRPYIDQETSDYHKDYYPPYPYKDKYPIVPYYEENKKPNFLNYFDIFHNPHSYKILLALKGFLIPIAGAALLGAAAALTTQNPILLPLGTINKGRRKRRKR